MRSLQWLVGTKPSHNPRHFPELKNTFPESEHTSQNPKYLVLESVLDHGTCFWILARIFRWWKVFSWWGQKPAPKCLLRQNLRIVYISFHFLAKLARQTTIVDQMILSFCLTQNNHGLNAVFNFKVKLISSERALEEE